MVMVEMVVGLLVVLTQFLQPTHLETLQTLHLTVQVVELVFISTDHQVQHMMCTIETLPVHGMLEVAEVVGMEEQGQQ